MEKEDIRKRHEKALREAIQNVKKARVSGALYCIKRISIFMQITPKDLESLPDGVFDFSSEGELVFIPVDENADELSFGLSDFHGTAIKNGENYTINSPIIIDKQFNTSILKKWEDL